MSKQLWDAVERNDLSALEKIATLNPKASMEYVKDGMTALHLAASKGNIEACTLIVNANIYALDVRGKSEKGDFYPKWTVLHFAASGVAGDEASVKLFENLAEIWPRLRDNACEDVVGGDQTLLHLAAARGKQSLCKLLFKWTPGAITFPDHNGLTPLHNMITYNHMDLLEWFMHNGDESEIKAVTEALISHAIKKHSMRICNYLIPKMLCNLSDNEVPLSKKQTSLKTILDQLREAKMFNTLESMKKQITSSSNKELVSLYQELVETKEKAEEQSTADTAKIEASVRFHIEPANLKLVEADQTNDVNVVGDVDTLEHEQGA